jgi:hypothetical protein
MNKEKLEAILENVKIALNNSSTTDVREAIELRRWEVVLEAILEP